MEEALIIASCCERVRQTLRAHTPGLSDSGQDPVFVATLSLLLPSATNLHTKVRDLRACSCGGLRSLADCQENWQGGWTNFGALPRLFRG